LNAYRNDLADIALTSCVIASHYAEPVSRRVAAPSALRLAPGTDANIVMEIAAGEPFEMLDDSLGWAWGYAGKQRRVGYVRSEALAAQ
jgi:hypothetical protein